MYAIDINERGAPESNNTIALVELTRNVPSTTSGAFCHSSTAM
jgi:hypothetical protein